MGGQSQGGGQQGMGGFSPESGGGGMQGGMYGGQQSAWGGTPMGWNPYVYNSGGYMQQPSAYTPNNFYLPQLYGSRQLMQNYQNNPAQTQAAFSPAAFMQMMSSFFPSQMPQNPLAAQQSPTGMQPTPGSPGTDPQNNILPNFQEPPGAPQAPPQAAPPGPQAGGGYTQDQLSMFPSFVQAGIPGWQIDQWAQGQGGNVAAPHPGSWDFQNLFGASGQNQDVLDMIYRNQTLQQNRQSSGDN